MARHRQHRWRAYLFSICEPHLRIGTLDDMCHFIFIGFPEPVPAEHIEKLAKSHKRKLSPAWMSISGHKLGSEIFYATAKYCDCNTSIGSNHRRSEAVADRIPRKLRAWRRKDWSEAKIARAIASMSDENIHKHSGTIDDDTRLWFDFLKAVVHELGYKHVALVLHWCGNESEFAVQDTKAVRLDEASHEDLFDWSEDVLYVCT